MTLERRSPLPIGRYWITNVGKRARQVMQEWLADRPQVSVISTEDHPDEDPPSTFYLFEVIAQPLPDWPSIELGFPNKATPDVRSEADTVQRPDVESPVGSVVVLWLLGALIAYEVLKPRARGRARSWSF